MGVSRAYLCARPRMSRFYEGLGWTIIERKVGPHRMGVFIRDAKVDGEISSPR
jgi:hypothetical protein